MSDICDHCGMPYATLYVLATDPEGNALLSHSMCDGCAMVFGQEPAEESSDEEDRPIQTDDEISESDDE